MKKPETHPIDIELPTTGFLRIEKVLDVIPVSKTTWWEWVKSGKAPAGIKLSKQITAWRVKDIRKFIDELDQQNAA